MRKSSSRAQNFTPFDGYFALNLPCVMVKRGFLAKQSYYSDIRSILAQTSKGRDAALTTIQDGEKIPHLHPRFEHGRTCSERSTNNLANTD